MASPASQIHVLAELERIGYGYQWSGENELRCVCPFHDDDTPSCAINTEKRVFKCQTAGCNASGDIISFLARVLKSSRGVIFAELSTRYEFDTTKVINPATVERYHSCLQDAGPLVKALEDRGITKALRRKYRLGEHNGRITIPIQNEGGLYVNIRRYLPGAPGKDKMRNTRGHGKIRLYPIEQLRYDEIMLCGGEIKAIAAADQLNRFNIGAVTGTAGEGNWDPSLTPTFQGKKMYVCLDIDPEGQKAAQERCLQLSRVARWVGNLVLPLDIDKHPHGDINDFVAGKGRLKPLFKRLKQWEMSAPRVLKDEKPAEVELAEAANASYAGRRVQLKASVTAMDQAPYAIPKSVIVDCDKSQKDCINCPIFPLQEDRITLNAESAAVLEMVSATRNIQREALMHGLGVPSGCKIVEFVPQTFYNVEDTRVSPQLEITNRAADRVMQPAVCIGEGLELNESYVFTGRMHPHPKTQQSTLLISEYKPTKDALSTYKCENLEQLDVFRPEEWTCGSIQRQLDDLYSDLEPNVTRIYQRRQLHLAVDLAYHSPLFIRFDGRTVKGWVEVLVLGDSSQGKSETALNLMRHYSLGEKVECKNASVAGLLGGLQQFGNKWFVTWGVIPTHDKRLVVLEELKGASTEVIARLTDMRSSGIAEIPKIEKRRTHARTRLVALSNPRSDQQLASYNYGIEAIKELIGGLEDVRRFDFCLLVSAGDIDPVRLNTLTRARPKVDHRYTGDLCRQLILWAWTREETQVVFDEQADSLVLDAATSLCERFTEAIPLIDRGSTRFKIARLAASLACRTFSTSEDKESVLVRPCHVEYIAAMLVETYSSPVFGYADFTEAIRVTTTLLDPKAIKKRIEQTPFPLDFCKQMLHTNKIDLIDIQDWCSWDRGEAMQMLSFLVRKHALVRDGRNYRKIAQFIKLLKELSQDKNLMDRPNFIEEEF